jgi:nucleotide-binding universal stress UspA family protein
MSIRTILATLDGTAIDQRVLDAACDIGRVSEARITALYADTDPRDIPAAYLGDGTGIYLSPELWQSLETLIAERRDGARKQFDEWKQRSGLGDTAAPMAGPTARLHIEIGSAPTLLGEHGPVADLIVTALPKSGETGKSMALEAALFDTGRPVLAIAESGPTSIAHAAPIAIAWNGRPEAARALSAALPILARGRGEIIVISIGEPDEPRKLAPAIDYLAMHGIAAHGVTLADRTGGTGALLLEEATKRGAGLLVMGAYTHNRWRELVLGGVTHHVIKHAALPVLFAH